MSRNARGWEPKNLKRHREHTAAAAEHTGTAKARSAADLSTEELAQIMGQARPIPARVAGIRTPSASVVRAVLAGERQEKDAEEAEAWWGE